MSARARQRRRRSRGSARKKLVVAAGILVSAVCLALGGAAVWVLDVAASAPSIDTLRPANSGANSEVFDAKGNSLGFVQSDVLREPVDLKEMPLSLQQATIAIEDEHFYDHNGVDYGAIIRAAVKNAESGEVVQGASTITQQLVRNLYIADPEDTIQRKIVEAQMARDYESEHSKAEILQNYLNTAPYGTTDGRSAIGVEAASQVFFDKDVSELGLKEAALLAGLPQAPTTYNPFLNPRAATARRNQVLDAMANQGYIKRRKARELKREGLGLERGLRFERREQQFFFDFVQQELIDRYGQRKVFRGGLKVYTTLNPKYQAAAQQALANHPVSEAESALVSTDTDTGAILAMASSEAYGTSQFNLAAQGERQPGSSFKPFVLTTAVDEGIDPDKTSYAAPSTITLQPDPLGEPWTVTGGGSGVMTLRDATVHSINTVYAQLGIDVGPQNFAEMAHKLGVTSHLDGFPAEALGGTTACCTVLEMSNAYATIADGGVHHDPTAITKVEFPDGKVDEPKDDSGQRVISDGVAYTVADIMKGVLVSGTAAGFGIGCPAAGKTGTTEQQSDAWFVGYTPHVSTAVWTGNPDARIPLPGYGGTLSAPIWHDYMLTAGTEPCDDFPKPTEPADLSAFKSDLTAKAKDLADEQTTDEEKGKKKKKDQTTTDEPVDQAPTDNGGGNSGGGGGNSGGGGGGGNSGGGGGGGGNSGGGGGGGGEVFDPQVDDGGVAPG